VSFDFMLLEDRLELLCCEFPVSVSYVLILYFLF
jgi:hypothetical protein